jgi:predicted RNase H-like HicB family nuclease
MRYEIKVKYGYDKQTDSYTAELSELDYVSYGTTFEECEINIREAVLAYLESNLLDS